jgi:hypothetical protein
MKKISTTGFVFKRVVLTASVLLIVLSAHRKADAAPRNRTLDASAVAGERIVELFDAMKAGDLEVKLIPKDSAQATVLIRNKTDKPLRIKLPEAFAGVPVLAQANAGFDGGNGGGGGGSSTVSQGMGGGMGGMGMGGMGGMGMGGMGMMGGMFNVAPDAIRKIKVKTVCLEHGKPDPNPRVAYEMKPIDEYTSDTKVIELCKMLGHGKIDQHAAQAAAWHFTDKLNWHQLATKIKVRHLDGSTELYFSPLDLQRAGLIVLESTRRAAVSNATAPSLAGAEPESVSPGRLADVELR